MRPVDCSLGTGDWDLVNADTDGYSCLEIVIRCIFIIPVSAWMHVSVHMLHVEMVV